MVDEFVAVEELHGLSAHDINKLLQDADSFVLNLTSAKGVSLQVSSFPHIFCYFREFRVLSVVTVFQLRIQENW